MQKLFLLLIITLTPILATHNKTLEQKIGQLILVGFHGVKPSDAWSVRITEQLKRSQVTGVMLLGYNIQNPKQLKTLTTHLKNAQSNMLLALDQEGGRVQRLRAKNGFLDYPSAKEIQKKSAFSVYKKMAQELKAYGFNYNLAPVADLDLGSPVISGLLRSYGSTDTVLSFTEDFVLAHKSEGIATALKHYPGHGSSLKDSHKGFVDVSSTHQAKEREVFHTLIRRNLAHSVMSAHLFDAKVDARYPATLSKAHLAPLRKVGFSGVIISDDLQMGAISKEFGLKTAVLQALKAGCNILLFSNYFEPDQELPLKVRDIILKALETKELDPRLIEDSFLKVQAFKQNLG